jgi:small subunit ribosomal protein S2
VAPSVIFMDEYQQVATKNLLVPLEKYLEAGVHIGSKFKSGNMNKFIYKIREDGLCVLDIEMLNNRIFTAAKFLAQYSPKEILIVAGRTYALRPAKTLAEIIGADVNIGRFIPGTLTNPKNERFREPKIVFAADPPVDRQAIKEAIRAKIPIISLCDSSNLTKNIDLIIPGNNKGKKSLAIVYWILAREILKARGDIKTDAEFTRNVEDFEARVARERKEDVDIIEEKVLGRRGRRKQRKQKTEKEEREKKSKF